MSARRLRVLVVYDCLYPHTVGGAERWYRNVALRLAAAGHEVTYATRRQWDRDQAPDLPGVRVVSVCPRVGLYTRSGRRRMSEAVLFGAGVLWHLLRRGDDYDVVHTASFPYFSLLAAGVRRRRYRLVVDWHELWTREYWQEYLGPLGRAGWWVQERCLRLPQRAFCFARMTAERLAAEGVDATVLEGQWEGPLEATSPQPAEPVAVFAGRLIAEKNAGALGPALAWARERVPALRCDVFGDGPARDAVAAAATEGLILRGFVDAEEIDRALASGCCMVLPSRREGYGKVVVEAARRGTPSVVVAAPDNAAAELVEEGVNGFVAASAAPEDLGAAIVRAWEAGPALRASTAAWFDANAERLSLDRSLGVLLKAYAA